MRVSSPGPPLRVSVPGPPISTSSPSPPVMESSPSPPIRTSSPLPPSMASSHRAGSDSRCVDDVAAVAGRDREPIECRFGAADVMLGRQTDHLDVRALAGNHDHVVADRAVDGHAVGAPSTDSGARGRGEVRDDVGEHRCRSGRGRRSCRCLRSALSSIFSTPSVSIVMLPTLRRNRTRCPFADTSKFSLALLAVEHHRVEAVLTLDDVAAVARIPLEHVVFAAEQREVVALLTVDEVVAGAAEQRVVAVAARDRVVAGAAVDRDLDERGEVSSGREAVVTAVGVEGQVLRRCRCRC